MAKKITRRVFPSNKIFIFGGAVRKKHYGDVDIAIEGISDFGSSKKILELYDIFEDSDFPKTVDLVDIDNADKSFQEYVLLHEKKIWI